MRRAACQCELCEAFRALFRAHREMWLGLREVAWIRPLRAITGRQRPNYRRIAWLEAQIYGLAADTNPAKIYPGELVISAADLRLIGPEVVRALSLRS